MATHPVEYKVVWADINRDLEADLNEAAADGWRIVQVSPPAIIGGQAGAGTTTVSGIILERAPRGTPRID